MPFLGLRNPGISHYGDKYPLPFYEPYGKRWLSATLFDRDHLMFCKSGTLISIFAENNYSIYAHAMLIKTPLLHQSFGPCVFLSFYSFCLSLSLYFWLIPWSTEARWAHFLARASEALWRHALCLHPLERAPGAYMQQRPKTRTLLAFRINQGISASFSLLLSGPPGSGPLKDQHLSSAMNGLINCMLGQIQRNNRKIESFVISSLFWYHSNL